MLVEFHIGGNIKSAKKLKAYVFGRTTKRQGYRPNPFDATPPVKRYDSTTYEFLEGIGTIFKPFRCKRVFSALLFMK